MVELASMHVIVSGRVQGVFFRVSSAAEARRLGCTGYVRNLPDGSVEVEAEGEQTQLENFLAYLRQGPEDAIVTEVQVSWSIPAGNYADFSIR